jgi:hypothetical protein
MIKDRPEAPVPPEVDMGANEFFPFYFDRLRKSKWWRRASDVARARNVMLWGEAYKSRPAGSLPDDDDELAEAAGYGLNVEAFLVHKAEIMAPWTLCADGRWYHPTVCEVVLETWERTSEKRRQDRLRQQARRMRVRQGAADAPSNVPSAPLSAVTRDTPPPSRVTTPDVAREIATQDKTRQDRDITVASAAPSATAPKPEPWKADPDFLTVWDAATPQMRKRAKSMAKAWPEWAKARRAAEPGKILAGLRGYLREDPDVQRTGGPGLHIWLRDRTFEQWGQEATRNPTAEQWRSYVDLHRETGRWSEDLGPPPGKPGCRAPAHLLLKVANQ